MLMLWLQWNPLRFLKEVVVLYANDKIPIYANNNMHKERKKIRKICPEQLHLSIKGSSSSSSSQRFFCALRTDDYTTGGGSRTSDHTLAYLMSDMHRGERSRLDDIAIGDAALDRGHMGVWRFCLFHTIPRSLHAHRICAVVVIQTPYCVTVWGHGSLQQYSLSLPG